MSRFQTSQTYYIGDQTCVIAAACSTVERDRPSVRGAAVVVQSDEDVLLGVEASAEVGLRGVSPNGSAFRVPVRDADVRAGCR